MNDSVFCYAQTVDRRLIKRAGTVTERLERLTKSRKFPDSDSATVRKKLLEHLLQPEVAEMTNKDLSFDTVSPPFSVARLLYYKVAHRCQGAWAWDDVSSKWDL